MNTQKKQYEVRGTHPFHDAVNNMINDFTSLQKRQPGKEIYLEEDRYSLYNGEAGNDHSPQHRQDGHKAIHEIRKHIVSRQIIDWDFIEKVAKDFESKHGFGNDKYATYEEWDKHLASLSEKPVRTHEMGVYQLGNKIVGRGYTRKEAILDCDKKGINVWSTHKPMYGNSQKIKSYGDEQTSPGDYIWVRVPVGAQITDDAQAIEYTRDVNRKPW